MPSRKSAAVSSSQWTESLVCAACAALGMVESRTISRMGKIVGRMLVVVVVVVIGIIPSAANSSTRQKPGSLAALGKTLFVCEDNILAWVVNLLRKINLWSTAAGPRGLDQFGYHSPTPLNLCNHGVRHGLARKILMSKNLEVKI